METNILKQIFVKPKMKASNETYPKLVPLLREDDLVHLCVHARLPRSRHLTEINYVQQSRKK